MEMIKGNLWKSILVFSIPLMITNLLQLLFNIADVAIVGKFAGAISLGAVGSTTLLIALTTGWLIGIANGVNALVAFFLGANDLENKKSAISTGFILCLAFGLFTMAIGLFFASPVLTLLGTKEELIYEACIYFRIYMLGSPALAIFNYGNSVLSAAGETKKPLNYLMISGIINIVLNLCFVIVFHMTAMGVALASIIAQYISAVLILKEMLLSSDKDYYFKISELCFSNQMAIRILKIGIPAAIQYSLFSIANLFVQSAVNSFDHVVVEGNSAAMNYDAIVYDMMAAFYAACTAFVAQNYGANKKDRIMKTYAITSLYSFGVAAILGVIIHIFRFQLLTIFTNDENVVMAGSVRLGILSLTYCLSALMDNSTAACRGLGKTIIPTIIVMFGSVVFRIIWIYTVFAYFGTLRSLYLLYSCAFTLTSIMGNIYFFRLYYKKIKLGE